MKYRKQLCRIKEVINRQSKKMGSDSKGEKMRFVYNNECLIDGQLIDEDELRTSLYLSPHIRILFHFVETCGGKILKQKVSVTWEKYEGEKKYIPTYRCVLELTDRTKFAIGQKVGEWCCVSVNANTCIFEIHSNQLTGMHNRFVSHWKYKIRKQNLETELAARFLDVYSSKDGYCCQGTLYTWRTQTGNPRDWIENLLFLKQFYDNHDKAGFLNSVKWDDIDSCFHWPRILFDYPELNEKCHCHEKFHVRNQMLLMIRHPFFMKYMQPKDWEYSYRYWPEILSLYPEGENVCIESVWKNIDAEGWGFLISNQPQFLEKCPVFSHTCEWTEKEQTIFKEYLPDILIHQPQLFDKLTSMFPDFKLDDFISGGDSADQLHAFRVEYQSIKLLSVYPEYIAKRNFTISRRGWVQLLVRQPQLWQYCPYCRKETGEAFSRELISDLIRFQPDLKLYMNEN